MTRHRLDPPNLLRCMDSECAHTEPFDGQELPFPCPICGGVTRVRCGTGPRPSSGRDHSCYAFARPGQRCRRHGRDSLRGPASPSWVHGGHSRFIPSRYRPVYERALSDPLAQNAMTVQLAILDAMQEEALHRLETRESGEAWDNLATAATAVREAIAAIREASAQQDGRLARDALRLVETELLPRIDDGAGEEATRREIVRLFEKRARLIRVDQQGRKTVPVEVLGALQSRFIALMAQYLQPRDLARLISTLREEAHPGWTDIRDPPVLVGSS